MSLINTYFVCCSLLLVYTLKLKINLRMEKVYLTSIVFNYIHLLTIDDIFCTCYLKAELQVLNVMLIVLCANTIKRKDSQVFNKMISRLSKSPVRLSAHYMLSGFCWVHPGLLGSIREYSCAHHSSGPRCSDRAGWFVGTPSCEQCRRSLH